MKTLFALAVLLSTSAVPASAVTLKVYIPNFEYTIWDFGKTVGPITLNLYYDDRFGTPTSRPFYIEFLIQDWDGLEIYYNFPADGTPGNVPYSDPANPNLKFSGGRFGVDPGDVTIGGYDTFQASVTTIGGVSNYQFTADGWWGNGLTYHSEGHTLSPIPLPASLPLLAGAVAVAGFVRRRKA
jgi:hypothetical protein